MESNILNKLKNNQLTTIGLSKELKLERHTLAKNLETMKVKGLIEYKQIGKAKLWSLSKSPLLSFLKDEQTSKYLKELLTNINQDITIIDKEKNVIWSNKENKGKCYNTLNGRSEICPNCPAENIFKNKSSNKNYNIKPIKNNDGETIALMELTK